MNNKVIFLHHQRTGGSSIRRFFIHQTLSIAYNDRIKLKTIESINKTEASIIELEPGCYLEKLEKKFPMFTVLRHPVDRMLSWIELNSRDPKDTNYVSTRIFEGRGEKNFWNDAYQYLNQEDVTYSVRFPLFNTYTKSYCDKLAARKLEASDYDLALERSNKVTTLIYNKETFFDDFIHMFKNYGISIPEKEEDDYPRMMVGNSEFIQEAPDWFRSFLAEKSQYDVLLYEEMCNKINSYNYYFTL